jgi:predicted metal-dependent hydrolase
MTDQDFLRALETCALPESEFGHTAHVRAAYLYLQAGEFGETLERLRRAIRNYAAFLGKPDRYHETITVAYVALIQQHICERGDGGDWQAFARDNPELFQPGLLLRFYSKTQLESELARRVFLLPHPRLPWTQACAQS